MSDFIKQQIEKQLAKLREDCGLQRLHLKNAHGPRWSGCPRRDPDHPSSWDKHWEDLQAQAQIDRPKDVAAADKALSDFIAEHRPIMGADWPGTDHGRLCWSDFLGGLPIDQHYCQREEGHDGRHADFVAAWPQGVTGNREWQELRERCPHSEVEQVAGKPHCAICGKEQSTSK